VVPEVEKIDRTSATEITVSWKPILAAKLLEVESYFIKYRPVLHNDANPDNLTTIVETDETTYLISGLDPGYSYLVSVAASNNAGIGNYSQEIFVRCECLTGYLNTLLAFNCLNIYFRLS